MDVCIRRRKLRSVLQRRQCAWKITLLTKADPQVCICVREIRVGLRRLPELAKGGMPIACLLENCTQQDVNLRVVWQKLDGLAQAIRCSGHSWPVWRSVVASSVIRMACSGLSAAQTPC